MISIPLLVVAIIAPVVLVFANLVILAKYVDPEHAAGHYIAKFAVVCRQFCHTVKFVMRRVCLLSVFVMCDACRRSLATEFHASWYRCWVSWSRNVPFSSCPSMWCVLPKPLALLVSFYPVFTSFWLVLWHRFVTFQGNKSGLVGCGFWNNNCGGLDMTLAWEIVYIVIAILVVVVFPFLIFMYEADDEGLTAAKAGKGKIGQMFDVAACGRAFLSAICYEAITLAVAIPVLILTWTYLGVTWIPVSATTVNLQGGGAFYPGACKPTMMLNLLSLIFTPAC